MALGSLSLVINVTNCDALLSLFLGGNAQLIEIRFIYCTVLEEVGETESLKCENTVIKERYRRGMGSFYKLSSSWPFQKHKITKITSTPSETTITGGREQGDYPPQKRLTCWFLLL